jgi:hypothetical protein
MRPTINNVAAVFAINAISLIVKPYLWFAAHGMPSEWNIHDLLVTSTT